jgi:DNA-binding CsgD family transcriptional regulator
MGALNEAAAQFRRALQHGDGLDGDARAELLGSYSLVLHLLNEIPDAYTVGHEALLLRRAAGDPEKLALHVSFLSLIAWLDGRGEEAWALARESVGLLEPLGDSPALAKAYAARGRLGLSSGRGDGGRAASRQALEVARRVGDQQSVAIALATLGTLERLADEASGQADLEESLRIAVEAHLPAEVDRALNNLGFTSQLRREFRDATVWFSQLEEHSERSEIERCSINSAKAQVALAIGDWITAELEARAALVAPRTDPIDRSLVMIVMASLGVRRGLDDVDAWLAAPIAAAEAMGAAQIRWPLAALAAERAWLAGTPEAALDEVRTAYLEAREQRDMWSVGELGAWLWRAGGLTTLEDDAALPYRLVVEGRTREAAAAWLDLEIPYEAALALIESADPEDVRRAHGLLSGLGATAVAAVAANRLRELGTAVPRGPRSTTRANPGGLTEREAEIAALLADGLSNAEIADRLVLSPKTVGHHVSAVLGKLDVPRRGAVAAAIRGMAPPR